MTQYGADYELTIKTNDPRLLLDTLVEIDCHVEVINGFTGELLCAQNCEQPYMQNDFGLMVLGRLMEKTWG